MTFAVRVAVREDIPGMHHVRLAVQENRLTSSAIREEHYIPAIEQSGRGWVAVEDDEVLGFAVGNTTTGNIWALFVDPSHEGRGIGRSLHDQMITWLFKSGLRRLWLSTDRNTRAQAFYEASGWQLVSVLPDGEAMYELHAPGAA
jgi:ribosomal protein S18 acetylase RimI-like enzyme